MKEWHNTTVSYDKSQILWPVFCYCLIFMSSAKELIYSQWHTLMLVYLQYRAKHSINHLKTCDCCMVAMVQCTTCVVIYVTVSEHNITSDMFLKKYFRFYNRIFSIGRTPIHCATVLHISIVLFWEDSSEFIINIKELFSINCHY